jgi:hypothetical protein
MMAFAGKFIGEIITYLFHVNDVCRLQITMPIDIYGCRNLLNNEK